MTLEIGQMEELPNEASSFQTSNPDVIFVSYDEPNADMNYERLLKLVPSAKRLHGVKGIGAAYRRAAALSSSSYFFMVDGDNWVSDEFSFRFPDQTRGADIYIWHAHNAVNGMRWLNGGIKLLNGRSVNSLRETAVDFFLQLRGNRVVVDEVASETRFNASPFLAWRAGFRECAKLAGGIVRHPASADLLEVWTTVGSESLNGNWCILGAKMGKAFGEKFHGFKKLREINNAEWLRSEFERCSKS